MTSSIAVRQAVPDDVDLIRSLIIALAEYEGEPESVTGTVEQLRQWLFGDDPAAEALIAERDGVPVGMALFYRTFSTWEGVPGLWLEDLFVLPEHRRLGSGESAGIGETLLRAVAELTVARGYARLEWTALDWNTPALSFYEKHGARVMSEWLTHRLSGESLRRLAAGPDSGG